MSNRFNMTVEKIVSATSSKQLCSALKKCRNILWSPFVNKTAFMEQLQKKIKEKAGYYKCNAQKVRIMEKCQPDVLVYQDKASYLVYSAFKLGLCSNVEEMNSQVSELINFFGSELTRPMTDMLNVDEVVDLLNIVQGKYGLIDIITDSRELEIFLMQKSHICYNSFLVTAKNMITGSLLNRWMIFSLSPCMDIMECNKYFVFLHELGHTLYYSITGGSRRPPAFFKELTMVLGFPVSDDDWIMGEYFADIFSATALNSTPYSDYNPYRKVFADQVFQLLDQYFKFITLQASEKIAHSNYYIG